MTEKNTETAQDRVLLRYNTSALANQMSVVFRFYYRKI